MGNVGNIPTEVLNPDLADAVIDGLARGETFAAIAQKVDLSEDAVSSISKRNRPVVEARRAATWPEFSETFKAKLRLAMDSLTPDKLAGASVRDISIMTGIFTDKALVIDGRPNVISSVEHSDRRAMGDFFGVLKAELERRGLSEPLDVTPDDSVGRKKGREALENQAAGRRSVT